MAGLLFKHILQKILNTQALHITFTFKYSARICEQEQLEGPTVPDLALHVSKPKSKGNIFY